MRASWLLSCLLAFALDAPRASAESWRIAGGQVFEGRLNGVYGSVAAITSRKGDTTLISVEQLDDAGLAKLADYLGRSEKAPGTWAGSAGKVATALRGRLQILQNGRLAEFDPGTRPEPEIFLVYFGAHWCRPCREFSPHLVEAYRRLWELAPGRFELVFVSSDRSQGDQELYAREVGMPWPILKFSEVGGVDPIERWAGPAIPDLVVLTRRGELLFDSFHGNDYAGPQSVLDAVEPLLVAMNEDSLSCRRAMHRLSVLQHVRGAAAGARGPQPYLIGLDRSHYQTLETKKLTVLLNVDERGRVTVLKIEPELPTALEYQLEQDALGWLFLPAVANGKPKASRVTLPIAF